MFQHTAARRRLLFVLARIFLLRLFQHTAARRRLRPAEEANTSPNKFQHTAARRRLLRSIFTIKFYDTFQHTAARRRLPVVELNSASTSTVSTHSRAEAAARRAEAIKCNQVVSTHSRAEAAAYDRLNYLNRCSCFNTQPRGGGCVRRKSSKQA